MTPEQFRAALADLGLSQVGFARLARVDPRTVRKWAAGDSRIPGPVVVLIELLQAQASAKRDFLPAGRAPRPPGGAAPSGAGVGSVLPRRSRGRGCVYPFE